MPLYDRIAVGAGKERDILILGVLPEYLKVRNLVVLSGRFFDAQDEQAHNKVGVITQKLAEKLYGSDAERRRQSHQAERTAFHRRRDIQGAGGYFRPVGNDGRYHGHSLHREPVLYRHP